MERIVIDMVNRHGTDFHTGVAELHGKLDPRATITFGKKVQANDETRKAKPRSLDWNRTYGGFVEVEGWPMTWIHEFEAAHAHLSRETWAGIMNQPAVGANVVASGLPIVFDGFVYGLFRDPDDRNYMIMVNLTNAQTMKTVVQEGQPDETTVYLGYGEPAVDTIYEVRLPVKQYKIQRMINYACFMLKFEAQLVAEYSQPTAYEQLPTRKSRLGVMYRESDGDVNLASLDQKSMMDVFNTGMKNKLFQDVKKKPEEVVNDLIGMAEFNCEKVMDQIHMMKVCVTQLEEWLRESKNGSIAG
ncbi:hypothetical protein EQG49_00420 [Periweissella cryptocerci]|uniref:Uncharacterized protein n=1 Tax=Periweissella cryptocerci TaxID=2506420 RepID=A0A4P6YQY1_9LACO|nr:hypothetical protein [Periweissella cryptocerci]QBO35018.1 hypothetical protein EQG49_00420 [Periweissella cryptocerci]